MELIKITNDKALDVYEKGCTVFMVNDNGPVFFNKSIIPLDPKELKKKAMWFCSTANYEKIFGEIPT
jgi:hypothetical protein